MENGDTTESGFPALFEKMPIFWDNAVRRPQFPKFYKGMTELRRSLTALRRGDLVWLSNTGEARIVTFKRTLGAEEVLVAINLASPPFFGAVQVDGRFEEVTPGVVPGTPAIRVLTLECYGFRIFKKKQ